MDKVGSTIMNFLSLSALQKFTADHSTPNKFIIHPTNMCLVPAVYQLLVAWDEQVVPCAYKACSLMSQTDK